MQYVFLLVLFFGFFSGLLSKELHNSPKPATGFVANRGQYLDPVLYDYQLKGGNLVLEKNRMKFFFYDNTLLEALHKNYDANKDKPVYMEAVFVDFVDPTHQSQPGSYLDIQPAGEVLPGIINYFKGNDPVHWAGGLKAVSAVQYNNLWPGADLLLMAYGEAIKYEIHLKAGANPEQIGLQYKGAEKIFINNAGDLEIKTKYKSWQEQKPVAWQLKDGKKLSIQCKYKLLPDGVLTFVFPQGFDPHLPIVIDPVLVFSSFSGSVADNWGFTATYDFAGDLYSGGLVFQYKIYTYSTSGLGSYPVTAGAFQSGFQGGECDMGIMRYNATGTQLVYSTYIGGNQADRPHSLICNSRKELYILGTTESNNFPITIGSFDNTYNGNRDIVVLQLDTLGRSLLAGTYVGGSGADGENVQGSGNPLYSFYDDRWRGEIILDAGEAPIIASCTRSADFPMVRAFDSSLGGAMDGCVFAMDRSLSVMRWSSFLGGSQWDAAYGLVVDNNQDVYVCGGTSSNDFPVTPTGYQNSYQGGVSDGFIVKIKTDIVPTIAIGTFYGTGSYDQAHLIQRDNQNNIYITGQTDGNLPITPGAYGQANSGQFITKLNPSISAVIVQTMFGTGGPNPDLSLTAFLVDNCQNIYVSGWGGLDNGGPKYGDTRGLVTSANALQNTTDGSDLYFYVLSKNAAGLVYASFLGDPIAEEHVDGGTSRFDRKGIIYQTVCAGCGRNNFPTTAGAWSRTNNSQNCNVAVYKMDFQLVDATLADFGMEAGFGASALSGCAPLPIIFTNRSTNADSIVWIFSDTANVNNDSIVYRTFQAPGTYTVQLAVFNTVACNLRDTITRRISVYPPPIPAFNPVIEPCGKKVTFVNNSSFAGSYRWNFGDGSPVLVTRGAAPITRTFANFGTYTVELVAISEDGRCRDSVKLNITLSEKPLARFIAQPRPCDSLVQFVNNSVSGVSYRWYFGDGDSSDLFAPAHLYTAGRDTYSVLLVVNPNSGCEDSLQQTVRLIGRQPTSYTPKPLLCTRTVRFENTTPQKEVLHFRWDFGDSTGSDSLHPTKIFPSPGSYWVQLTSLPGTSCADSVRQIITIPYLPTAEFTAEVQACSPTVKLTSTGPDALQWRWEFGDGTIGTNAVETHTFPDTGSYTIRLTVNPDSNCRATQTKTIRVVSPKPAFIFDPPGCSKTVQFRLAPGSNLPNPERAIWQFGDGTTGSGPAPLHTFASAGIYTVKLITEPGTICEDSITQVIQLPEKPTAEIIIEKPTCGSTVKFSATGTLVNTGIWEFGDSAIPNGSGLNVIIDYPKNGTYTARFIANPDSICQDTIEKNVTIFIPGEAFFELPTVGCDTNLTLISQAKNQQAIRWQISDGRTFTDSVVSITFNSNQRYQILLITDPTSPCPDTHSVDITFPNIPKAGYTYIIDDCNKKVLLQSLYDSDSINWQWKAINQSQWNIESQTTKDATLFFPVIDSYEVRQIVGLCSPCPDTMSKRFSVGYTTKANFVIPDGSCDSVIYLTDQSTRANEWNWKIWKQSTDSLISVINAAAANYVLPGVGDYRLQLIINPNTGCADSIEKLYRVHPTPIAKFSYQGIDCSSNYRFYNQSTGAARYVWDFGNGRMSTATAPEMEYITAGNYIIKLKAISEQGCEDTSVVILDFDPSANQLVLVPSAFTPNNDGMNEVFKITGGGKACVESIEIFNRWGERVYAAGDTDQFWDGTYEGKKAPEGVYVYVIKGKNWKKTGTVTLLY